MADQLVKSALLRTKTNETFKLRVVGMQKVRAELESSGDKTELKAKKDTWEGERVNNNVDSPSHTPTRRSHVGGQRANRRRNVSAEHCWRDV